MATSSKKQEGLSLAKAYKDLNEIQSREKGSTKVENTIVNIFIAQNRVIRNMDFQALNPASIVEKYLKPRQELYCFIIVEWLRRIFLPTLSQFLLNNIFLFGLGRLFSRNNDMGVQNCTDIDLNIIVSENVDTSDIDTLYKKLLEIKKKFSFHFEISLEISKEFSVLKVSEVIKRINTKKNNYHFFYKSIQNTHLPIHSNKKIEDMVFATLKDQPDSNLFDYLVGNSGTKPTYFNIRYIGQKPHFKIGSSSKVLTSAIIGERNFDNYCSRLFTKKYFLSPPDWYFSIKYFVNRVYDYVSSVLYLGYSLKEIGIGVKSETLGVDPDYRFLCNAHKLMLFLQELIYTDQGSFNSEVDTSYMSKKRFIDFMEIGGEKFRNNFDLMMVKGDVLLLSEKEEYLFLRKKCISKDSDRIILGRTPELKNFPTNFHYELLYRDQHDYKIRVPYTWADLGYFSFYSISRRIIDIVDNKLMPATKKLGASPLTIKEYKNHMKD